MSQASGQTYDFLVPANGAFRIDAVGNYFLLKTSSGALNVRMGGTSSLLKGLIQGQGVQDQAFVGLELFNPTAAVITGTVFVADGGFFDLNLILSGGINVRPKAANAHYENTVAVTANTAVQVFNASANTNGAIILTAGALTYAPSITPIVLIAKATAPISITDGEVLAVSYPQFGGANLYQNLELKFSQKIQAGLGLYFIHSQTETASFTPKFCRYLLL